MAPKKHAGKEMATSATAPLSLPLVIEHPIAGRKFFPFQIFLSLSKAVF